MTHRIYYNVQWRGPVFGVFFDKLEEVGEIRTTAEGFSMFTPGDKFQHVIDTFRRYNVPMNTEQAPDSTSAWPLSNRHDEDNPLTPAFLECAVCHEVLTGNAAQLARHNSEHLRELIDNNRLAMP